MSIADQQQKSKLQGLFDDPVPTANYTLITSDKPLSKRYGVEDGAPMKLGSDAPLVSGRAIRRTLTGSATAMLDQLSADLVRMGQSNAVICAPPPDGKPEWPIVTLNEVDRHPGSIARSKEHFRPPAGLAVMGLDFDTRDYPEFIRDRLLAMGGANLSTALSEVCPELGSAASLTRASMSTGIRAKSTGKTTPPNGGMHRFYIADDGRRVGNFAHSLRDRLMLSGWLWGFVTKNGSILFRTLFDVVASSDTSRLWYEGLPVLEDGGLEYIAEARKPNRKTGGVLDTTKLAPLTVEEQRRLDQMKDEVRQQLAGQAKAAFDAWSGKIRSMVPAAASPFGLSSTMLVASQKHELEGSFPIHLDDQRVVTPREILAAPSAFHKATCADPLEPDYNGGRNIAIIYSDNSAIRIESQAHGGITYWVRPSVDDHFELPKEDEPEQVDDTPTPRDVFGDGEIGAAVLQVPRGALPPVIDTWAVDVAERVGAPPAFAAVAALATISGAIGSKLRIQPKQHDSGWLEPAFLWFSIIEAPGGRKSPIIGQATAPLAKLDAQRAREGGQAWAQWEERKKATKRGTPFTEPEPKVRRHVVDNFTVEALTGVLADNESGVLVSMDELTGLIGSLDAYKANKGSDRPMMLRLFDGRENRVDRVGRKHTHIPCWGASVIGGIQPKKITEMASDLDADGLLQRFLPVWGDGERHQGLDREPDQSAMAAYDAAVQQLARAEFPAAQPIRLSKEAHVVWREVGARLAALSSLPGLSDAWAGHMGKWPGFSARLLLVCHVLAHLDDLAAVDAQPVAASTATQASKLVDWLVANSIRFYVECIGAGEAGNDAKWIAGFILSSGAEDQITRRDIGQARRDLRDQPKRIGQAMRFLEHNGWVTANMTERVDSFGPSRWTICPAVHDGRFAGRAEIERKRRAYERARIEAAVRERRRLLGEGGSDE